MKSYGGIDMSPANPNGEYRRNTLGNRLDRRRGLLQIRRLVVDCICFLALVGIILMIIETEMYINHFSNKEDTISFVFKFFISVSTFFLLIGICVNYFVDLNIKALDAGVKDWHAMIKDSTWICLFLELCACAVHPFPGDMRITYTSPGGESRRVSIDAILSILMMVRLYLIAKFAVVHSRLVTDTSTRSIGALSKIKINTSFVFKAVMSNTPSRLLLFVMVTTFIVNSWAMRTCESYYEQSEVAITYSETMWLVATTFLTVGYGDTIPKSYCGRYISVCTGIMGVGTTALLVAVLARKLEQSRSERYVFNMVTRIHIEKKRKTAAANVIKSVIQLWMIRKYSKQDKQLRRKYEDQLKTSVRQLHIAKAEKDHIDEFNVGIIEVSETVNRLNSTTTRIENKQDEMDCRNATFENRLFNIEVKLDEIRTILSVKR